MKKNLNRWAFPLVVIALLLLTTGCTRVMKTASARKSLNQLNSSVVKSLKKMNRDLAEKRAS